MFTLMKHHLKLHSFKIATVLTLVVLSTQTFTSAQAQGPGGGIFASMSGMFGQMGGGRFNQNRTSAMDPSKTDIMTLIKRQDVQADILLTSAQREKLEAFDQEVKKQRQGMMSQVFGQFAQFGSMTQEERQAKIQEIQEQAPDIQKQFTGTIEEQNKKLEKMLSAKQNARLHELDLRWRGAFAMSDQKVSDEMKLDKPAYDKIKAAFEAYQKTQQEGMRSIFAGAFGNQGGGAAQASPDTKAPASAAGAAPQNGAGGFQRPNFAELQKKMDEAQKKDDKIRKVGEVKLLASLTPEQSKLWTTMLGRKFVFRIYDPANP